MAKPKSKSQASSATASAAKRAPTEQGLAGQLDDVYVDLLNAKAVVAVACGAMSSELTENVSRALDHAGSELEGLIRRLGELVEKVQHLENEHDTACKRLDGVSHG
jgi:hypothetical protein